MKVKVEYRQTRSNVIMMNPLPNINQAYKIVLQEEHHKQISNEKNTTEVMAFAADKKRTPDQQSNNFFPNRGGSTSNRGVYDQGRGVSRRSSTLHCEHCNYAGHTIDRCYKLHGFPKDSKHNNPPKKYAHTGKREETNANTSTDDMIHTSFTREQYSHLLSIIEKG